MSDKGMTTETPPALVNGVPMLKISSKKIKQVTISINDGCITWATGKGNKIPIGDIRELRLNQPPTDGYTSSRWITVVYARSTQWKVLHMTALNHDNYKLWADTLTTMVSETSDRLVNDITPSDPDLMWIRQLWPAGAKVIDFGTAAGLCGGLGMVIPPKLAAKYDRTPLDLGAFRRLIKDAQTRPEFESIYTQLRVDGPPDRARVEAFLRDVQQIEPGGIFERYQQNNVWNLDSLTSFLLATDKAQRPKMDMTRPLPEYYVSSSHNTYLLGEQWRGESTVEGYIRILLARGRCVEMDCHDGDIEPEVYHQKTLTRGVPVRDICQAINKYAFVTSSYPVIISAEIHCSIEQQDRLAQVLRDTFGDKLVDRSLDDVVGMPSPEELKNRILVKAKPPSEKNDKQTSRSELLPSDSTTSSTESDSGFARLARRLSISDNQRPSFSPALADLLVYTAGVKYQGFSKLVEYEPRHQFSVSDRTANRIIRENQTDWIKHNFTHLSRVYPRGVKLSSANYDPVPAWAAGNQIVALNWQTLDEAAVLNHAMFADTAGYVLKPVALRQKTQEQADRYRIRIHIVSAQRLPLSSDLYVSSHLTLPSEPRQSPTRTTRKIKSATLNPYWDECVSFDLCSTPSRLALTFLHLEIYNKDLVAQWVRPVDRAPRGYHHLPLYDSLFSKYVFATLFVRIDVDIL